MVPNLAVQQVEDTGHPAEKVPGSLRLVFLSRISRMKNLDGALALLRGLPGQIRLDICGPIDDADYWAECQRTIAALPRNVRVDYRGVIAHEQVVDVLKEAHLFLLPTRGENFGHAIVEAWAAGLPVLISDRTPWRGLERKGAGWDVPLEQPERFERILADFVQMDGTEFQLLSRQARRHWGQIKETTGSLDLYRRLFESAGDESTCNRSFRMLAQTSAPR